MFKVTILTLYPEIFQNLLSYSVLGRALEHKVWELDLINIRDFATDKYKTVDDSQFGGGKGLLLKPDVLAAAIEHALARGASKNLIFLTPSGQTFNQERAQALSNLDGMTIICGHFKGIDCRIIEKYNPVEISIGDFVLTGGEFVSMVMVDACVRLLPNGIGSAESREGESFTSGLLEPPHYTRPYDFEGLTVPRVLLSGDHKAIREWRLRAAQERTKIKRPDMWKKYIEENRND